MATDLGVRRWAAMTPPPTCTCIVTPPSTTEVLRGVTTLHQVLPSCPVHGDWLASASPETVVWLAEEEEAAKAASRTFHNGDESHWKMILMERLTLLRERNRDRTPTGKHVGEWRLT